MGFCIQGKTGLFNKPVFIYEGIVFCMKKFLCPPHKRAVKRTAKAPETYATSILRGDFDMHLGRCLQCRGKFYFL